MDWIQILKVYVSFQTERMTNLSAVAANLKKETKLPSSDDSEETFEMKYNRACYLLAQGRWEEAEKVKKNNVIRPVIASI